MKKIVLFSCLVLMYNVMNIDGLLLKHLSPRPGGIIDRLTKPRIPGGFQLSSNTGGGISLGLGSFGFNLGINKQYVPGGVNQPPKEPHVPEGETGYSYGNPYVPGVKPGYPDGNPYVPDVKPEYPKENPYIPDGKPLLSRPGSFGFNLSFNKQFVPGGVIQPPQNPHIPDGNPYIPGLKPGYPAGNPYVPGEKPEYPKENPYVPEGKPIYPEDNPYVPGSKPAIPQNPEIKPSKPSITWEDEENEKIPYYPPSKEKDYSKPESFEDSKKDYPKPGSYENTGSPKREDKDPRPDWEDIGEIHDKDPKAENYMDSDLVGDGLIQPRLNKKRSKRFIESKIYHVPILFRSNAQPSRVKIHNSLNGLEKGSLKK